VPSVRDFVRDAFTGELGMTVPDEPGLSFGSARDDDEMPDPEADAITIDAITAFIELLAPPPRNRVDVAIEDRGEVIFNSAGCANCHVPTLQTADGVEVHAFTDLLLHDPRLSHAAVVGPRSDRTVSTRRPRQHDRRRNRRARGGSYRRARRSRQPERHGP
jgi:CxxC motif-containing protein (DUF1111 family)